MARIDRYVNDTTISNDDRLIGTDANDQNRTKNFTVAALRDALINVQAGFIPVGGGNGELVASPIEVTSDGTIMVSADIVNENGDTLVDGGGQDDGGGFSNDSRLTRNIYDIRNNREVRDTSQPAFQPIGGSVVHANTLADYNHLLVIQESIEIHIPAENENDVAIPIGAWYKVANLNPTDDVTIHLPPGHRLQGEFDDDAAETSFLTLDDFTQSFEMVYTGIDTVGWIILSA